MFRFYQSVEFYRKVD